VSGLFLSWTTQHARDHAAKCALKRALAYYKVECFDFTDRHGGPLSDGEIRALLAREVGRARCSLELLSANSPFSGWTQEERRLLGRTNGEVVRIVVALDAGYERFVQVTDEHRVVRIGLSDGRAMGCLTEEYEEYRSIAHRYFTEERFLARCLALSLAIRRFLETGERAPLEALRAQPLRRGVPG
jgi:hypothetical protein